MDFYGLGSEAALEKFAVSSTWLGDRLKGGLQSRMTRLGPGAAAQDLQEFAARQGARAQALQPKMRQAGLLERLFRVGTDLAVTPLTLGRHEPLSSPGGMVDDNAHLRQRRLNMQDASRRVLSGTADRMPELSKQFAQGAARPNKPTSLLTGDVLRKALGRK